MKDSLGTKCDLFAWLLFLGLILPLIVQSENICSIRTCTSLGKPCGQINGKYVGCMEYNTYCNYNATTNPTCMPTPGLNEPCVFDPYAKYDEGICSLGLVCNQSVCQLPKYYLTSGQSCNSDNDCDYKYNASFPHQCIKGKCFGPKLGDKCEFGCDEGYCNANFTCAPFIKEGEDCTLERFVSSQCEMPTWCNPIDELGNNFICTRFKTVPLGKSCDYSMSELCAGNNICLFGNNNEPFGTCGPINQSTNTYSKICSIDKECAGPNSETCQCDFTTGQSTCNSRFLPFTNNYAEIYTDFNECLTTSKCYRDEELRDFDDICFLNACPKAFCGYIEQQENYIFYSNGNFPNSNYCRFQQTISRCKNLNKPKPGFIAGVVFGAVVVVLILAGGIFYAVRRFKSRKIAKRYPILQASSDEVEGLIQT